MATTVSYSASMRTRKTNSASNTLAFPLIAMNSSPAMKPRSTTTRPTSKAGKNGNLLMYTPTKVSPAPARNTVRALTV